MNRGPVEEEFEDLGRRVYKSVTCILQVVYAGPRDARLQALPRLVGTKDDVLAANDGHDQLKERHERQTRSSVFATSSSSTALFEPPPWTWTLTTLFVILLRI